MAKVFVAALVRDEDFYKVYTSFAGIAYKEFNPYTGEKLESPVEERLEGGLFKIFDEPIETTNIEDLLPVIALKLNLNVSKNGTSNYIFFRNGISFSRDVLYNDNKQSFIIDQDCTDLYLLSSLPSLDKYKKIFEKCEKEKEVLCEKMNLIGVSYKIVIMVG